MGGLGKFEKYYEERKQFMTMEKVVSCRSVNGDLDELQERLNEIKPTHIFVNSSGTNLDLLVLL